MFIIKNIIICLLFISVNVMASEKKPQWWDYSVNSIGLGVGYSYAFNSFSTESGSLSDIQDVDTSGGAFNVNVLLDNQYNSLFKPYVDYTFLYHSDRKFTIFGTGLQFDFPIDNSALSFYLAGGVGYGMSSWSHIPISGYLVNSVQSTSFVGTLKSGMAYQLTKRFSLGLSLRYDFYDLDAKVVDNNYASENNVTNIVDHGSASVLFEVKYRFSDLAPNITSSASIYSTTSIQSVPPSKAEYILPFDLRYSTYRGEKVALLSQIQKQLMLNQDYQVLIVGHTDSQGAKVYNQILSEQRALSIKHLLIAYGVPAARIDCSAQGESYPIATNSTKRGRQKNRRVSVTFIQN